MLSSAKIKHMKLHFDKDLKKLTLSAFGNELAQIMGHDTDENGNRVYMRDEQEEIEVVTIDSPVLVTDNYKIAQLDPIKRDTVFALYSAPTKITDYDGTVIRFEQKRFPGVWGPSIDTLLFCRALSKVDLSGVKKVLEIGPGSGFISKYILDHVPGVEKLYAIDLNEKAAECTRENIPDSRVESAVGDALEFIKDNTFDLIVCNPPYIPRPKSIDDNPYEGVSLLAYLLERGKEHLNPDGVIVTNISSLSDCVIDPLLQEKNISVSEIDSMIVPLKVYNVLNNTTWMEYLLENKGLIQDSHDGYDFWHKLKIVLLK